MVTRRRPQSVIGTREVREQVPALLRRFREEGADAEPVLFGAQRKPEAVMLSFAQYVAIMDQLDDDSIARTVADRLHLVEHGQAGDVDDFEAAARSLGFDPAALTDPA